MDNGNAFTIPELWEPLVITAEEPAHGAGLFPLPELDVSSAEVDNPYAPGKDLDHDLRLPDLETFRFGPLEELEVAEQSVLSSDTEQQRPAEEDDIWATPLALGPTDKDALFITWEAFEQLPRREPRSAYVSEAGPGVFDAALQQRSAQGASKPGNALPADLLLASLYHLGMGRDSVLFSYDAKSRSFTPALEDIRASGYSLASVQSLVASFVRTGNAVKYLQDVVESSYVGSAAMPARTALASAISTILTALEEYIASRGHTIRSLLHLQALFERPQRLLNQLQQTVASVESANASEDLIYRLYRQAQDVEQQPDWLRQCMLHLLARVSEPWLKLVGEWTGLLNNSGQYSTLDDHNGSLQDTDELHDEQPPNSHLSGYMYNANTVPDFVAEEDKRMIFETRKSLRFIRRYHPDHPLSSPEILQTEPPAPEWKYEWRDMEAVAEKAKEYERRLLEALREYRKDASKPVIRHHVTKEDAVIMEGFGQDPGQNRHGYVAEMAVLFDQPPQTYLNTWPDELREILVNNLGLEDAAQISHSSTFVPPLSLTSMLSLNPLLSIQGRIVNSASLRLLFRAHDLRLHLSVQHNYHLLGDGMFVARLSSTLFSPELATAERHRGVVRTGAPMGLKLGSRKTWPPASSELQLALMGVLSDCYHASALHRATQSKQDKPASRETKRADRAAAELPGNLSFAVRTLSAEDADKCMDPHSLYALDFLRLQYTPPQSLEVVITAAALDKYDQVFKLLLRLTRMLFVVSHLPRDIPAPMAKKFRNEAHHFVTTISAYLFDTGVSETYNDFSSSLDDIEKLLQREDDNGQIGQLVPGGLESLRMKHEQFLDKMLFALLLRKRQAQVMGLLEEILEAILKFEKLVREQTEGWQKTVEQLRENFRAKVGVFLTVCRGLIGRRGYGKGKTAAAGEENTVERLVLLLDMNGYYSVAGVRSS